MSFLIFYVSGELAFQMMSVCYGKKCDNSVKTGIFCTRYKPPVHKGPHCNISTDYCNLTNRLNGKKLKIDCKYSCRFGQKSFSGRSHRLFTLDDSVNIAGNNRHFAKPNHSRCLRASHVKSKKTDNCSDVFKRPSKAKYKSIRNSQQFR